MSETSFTWLHLTDLHVGQALATPRWSNSIEEEVSRDLQTLVKRSGPIDAVFFTGDLTQQGVKDEFDRLDQILARLLTALPQDNEPVFLAVPGNHDLVRPPETSAVVQALGQWTINPTLRTLFWSDSKCDYRTAVDDAFRNWTAWADTAVNWNRMTDVRRDGVLPGDFVSTLEVGNLRIGIVGLNSAALQLANGDYTGKLCLNGIQVAQLVEQLPHWIKSHDASFLLTHHDASWLDEDGREALFAEIFTPGRFVAHLCGHRHEQARTLISEGGALPHRTVVGRSLFGMDWYGDHVERRHGYTIGQIRVGISSRTMNIWPRWDVRKQGGHLEIVADQSETLVDGWATEPEDLGPSPRVDDLSAHGSGEPGPPGWERVDIDFLDRSVHEFHAEGLRAYFDGEDPGWPEIASGHIPMLSSAERLLASLHSEGSVRVTVHLVLGPGGEGKSTALMQVAASLGRADGWRVLCRRSSQSVGAPGQLKWSALKDEVSRGRSICLVVDDAHEVRGEVERFLQPDQVNKNLANDGSSIHLVLCAHEDEWARSQPRRVERWPRSKCVSTLNVRGLIKDDAKKIVAAYRESDSLELLNGAMNDDVLADQLVAKAHERSSAEDEAALLGALLEARTGESLEVHVERILDRVAVASSESGLHALRIYITTAAANSLGVHRLNAAVLRAAVGITDGELLRILSLLGAELRADGMGENRSIRLRHSSIARHAVKVAFSQPPGAAIFASEQEIFRDLGRGAGTVPEFWRAQVSRSIIDLTVSERRRNCQAAVSIAEGLVEGAPENDHLRSRLAQTYREVANSADPIAAEATVAQYFREYPSKIRDQTIRPLILEWAVSSGLCTSNPDHGARNTWLAMWSFSDQAGQGIPLEHARRLSTVTMGISLIEGSVSSNDKERVAAVVVAALARMRATRHRAHASRLAGEMLGVLDETALAEVLRGVSGTIWNATAATFRSHPALPRDGSLTFRALSALVEAQE